MATKKSKYPIIWDQDSVQSATECEINGNFTSSSLCIDSRAAVEGDIFIALKGRRVDSHDYVSGIIDTVSAAIVDRVPNGCESKKDKLIIVKDTLQALRDLALYNRDRCNAKIIAVTGSVGKTSTKEQLKLVYEKLGKVHCSEGNYNSQVTCPLSVASMPLDTEYGIFELGMSFAGEMTKLTQIARPDISIITTIAPCHAENFDSISDIARAKAEIFLGMEKNGNVILNFDNEYYKVLEEEAKNIGIKNIIRFGEDKSCESVMDSYERVDGISKVTATILSKKVNYEMVASGKHHAMNSVAALTSIAVLGLDLDKASSNLKSFGGVKGRGLINEILFEGKKISLIDESYNASPASVKAALSVIGGVDSRRKLAVLADMRELGKIEEGAHKELSGDVMSNIDKVITVGPLMKMLYDELPEDKVLAHFDDYEQVMSKISGLIDHGDCVLVKGSLGTKIFELVNFIQGKK